MTNKIIELYNKYYTYRKFEREEVFSALREKYGIKNTLYPGSYVHITPSFIFPTTVYVDCDKGAKFFFNDMKIVKEIIESRKKYSQESNIEFLGKSYNAPLSLEEESFDLLISHYAGIISQPCKKYLKTGGLLLVNNSHADAGVASFDTDFKLIGTINIHRKKLISEDNLETFFIPKKKQNVTMETLISTQKGIGYLKTADLYIFKKIK
ncbi:hypothetical protein PG911_09555 [Tenacibaculum ovolyticum]|uniref:hypothetical protein n=1 Tax=Tenacibaculum ovolyticum TaxID=104270 RepID=UPI0022F3F480|nr:hypothetical protein [Tenacibaculum ovolyticum]WBX74903.1 hypothetical protein PG911_09555 [Tenacibaculum ovolyticum]